MCHQSQWDFKMVWFLIFQYIFNPAYCFSYFSWFTDFLPWWGEEGIGLQAIHWECFLTQMGEELVCMRQWIHRLIQWECEDTSMMMSKTFRLRIFFQAIMLITTKQQVFGEIIILKNWSLDKLVLWWIGSQPLNIWLIFYILVHFL